MSDWYSSKSSRSSETGFCSVQHGLALIVHLCNFSLNSQKMSLSIAMPAMVNSTAWPGPLNASTERPSANSQDGWNETLQQLKAVVMVLTSQYSIWVKWAPPLEKSQLINIASSGELMGAFITLLVGGFLCQTKGWPSIFYIFGGIGCACSFLWFPLAYDDPINHPFISTSEKEYIVCSLAQQDCSPGWSLPIKAMIKSLPLWGILVFYFTGFWTFNILMAYMPTYISSVLQANLRDSGILSALLLGVAFISTILSGLLADFLHSRNIFRLVTIRKLSTAIGVLVSSVVLVSLYWVRSSISTSMGLLALSSATTTFCQTGALINFLDIAPRYTSFLRGLSQVFGHLSGAISSTVAGFLISQDSEFGWRNVFLISVSINMSGLVFYLTFSQAKVQDWATEQTVTQL
ncbi:probable small intestine urate exporter isoform X2 [Zalophus californianus]|uniref:Probable small intestine urate exporter isoform X2 n=1 Tax=Zalophus californianus TaxID=9704 RepID=A0A6J2DV79_ZALCA|nr:probable small intestine urate exporter isoform X2 [Zalophus californianus]